MQVPQFPHLNIWGRGRMLTPTFHATCLEISGVKKIQEVLGEGCGAGKAAHLSSCQKMPAPHACLGAGGSPCKPPAMAALPGPRAGGGVPCSGVFSAEPSVVEAEGTVLLEITGLGRVLKEPFSNQP